MTKTPLPPEFVPAAQAESKRDRGTQPNAAMRRKIMPSGYHGFNRPRRGV